MQKSEQTVAQLGSAAPESSKASIVPELEAVYPPPSSCSSREAVLSDRRLFRWATRDPLAAVEWISTQELATVDRLLPTVVAIWARYDPKKVAEFVELVANDEIQNQLTSTLAAAWAKKDLPAALDWLGQLESGDARRKACVQVFSYWGQKELVAAIEWSKTSLQGEEQDAVFETLALEMAKSDPDLAFELAEGISGEKNRVRSQECIARVWVDRDLEAAARRIALSGIPVESYPRIFWTKKSPEKG